MIKVIKFLVRFYHQLFPSSFRTCRYDPTCSQYCIDAFKKYGPLKGGLKTLTRLLSCHPLSTRPLIDPA